MVRSYRHVGRSSFSVVSFMIVRQFLHWLRTAPSGTRAEATGALARAYLYSDLSDSDRIAAEGAMTMLLDDPSPLLLDADLVEAVASGEAERQGAVAMRAMLPCSVAAAIAEVGCAEACLVLLENPHAEIVPFSLDRIVERHGHLAAIRDTLLSRLDLPAPTRQALVVKLAP